MQLFAIYKTLDIVDILIVYDDKILNAEHFFWVRYTGQFVHENRREAKDIKSLR